MKDRQHLDLFIVTIHHVDDAVVAVEHLADRFITDFRHHPTHTRKSFECPYLRNHLLLEHLREVGCTDALVILDDRVEFVLRLFGKPDSGHGALLGLFGLTATLEPSFNLVERHGLSFAGLLQPNLDLVQEDETLDGIFDGGVLR